MFFPLIDVLRAFAALSVVVFHVIAHFDWTSFPVDGPLVWFRIGGQGVDLFFVISGFVIAQSTFSRLQRADFRSFAATFCRTRLARIVPLHYLTCILFLVFIQPDLVFVPGIWRQVVSHALFVHNWFLMHAGGINGVNWSVAVEMQFYLLMLLTARWLVAANPWAIGLGAIAIAWAWRFAVFLLVSPDGPWGVFPIFVYTTQLPGMLDEFAAGILLARFLREPRGKEFLARARSSPWLLLGATAAILTAAMRIYWANAEYWNSGPMVVAFKSLLALGWVMVLATACVVQYPLAVWLTTPLRYLGTISYGIYLWHLPVILALRRVKWVDGALALPWVIGLTVLLAAMSWHIFEYPLILRHGAAGRRSALRSNLAHLDATM